MSISILCRTCGWALELSDDQSIICCPACSTRNSRPKAKGPTLEKLKRAIRLRLAQEYTEAEQYYEAVLAEYDDEHDALWGRLLCHYGVEHIDSDDTGERILVVHRPRRTPMQSSADFIHACELAPPEVRSQYKEDAARVDDEQAELRLMAENCEPYDVFLCHKTTVPGDKDKKTDDFTRAFELYHLLDKQGFRVFFAPLELQGILGTNYGAGITYALQTSRVMLVLCSDPDYVNSRWVRSEWHRYIVQMDREGENELIRAPRRALRPLLYGGMKPEMLPSAITLHKFNAISMESPTAHQNLMDVVEKFCGPRRQQGPFATEATEGGLCITGYTGPGGQVNIPAEIGGEKVVEIGENAFRDNPSIVSVNIPEGVNRIAASAFWNCAGLLCLQLPASLQGIANGAFGACTALRTIVLAPGNAHFALRDNVLYHSGGALVCYPAGLTAESFEAPEGTVAAWQNAFAGCVGLRRVTFPDSVRFIAQDAFYGCVALTLRSHENTCAHKFALDNHFAFDPISSYAPEAHFTTVPTSGGVAITDYTGPGGEVLIPPTIGGRAVVEIADYGLSCGRPLNAQWDIKRSTVAKITRVVLPEGLQRIGEGAFHNCTALTGVVIPRGVTSIGEGAFRHCTALTEMTLPEGVTHMGDGAFLECSSLQDVSLPATLTSVGDFAFMDCPGLRRMVIPEGVTHLGQQAFMNCTALESIHLPATLTDIEHNPFMGCASLRSIVIAAANPVYYAKGSVILSRSGALVCYPASLTAPAYVIPEGVTAVGVHAFAGCAHLKSLTIPASVTSIGDWAFDHCDSITLRVADRSCAHQYAQLNRLRFELLSPPQPAARAAQKPEGKATLRIVRSLMTTYASRKICVRIDGKQVLAVGNGERYSLPVNPGHIQIDVKMKPMVGEVDWNARGGLRNIFPTEMEAGHEYVIDVARYITALS